MSAGVVGCTVPYARCGQHSTGPLVQNNPRHLAWYDLVAGGPRREYGKQYCKNTVGWTQLTRTHPVSHLARLSKCLNPPEVIPAEDPLLLKELIFTASHRWVRALLAWIGGVEIGLHCGPIRN